MAVGDLTAQVPPVDTPEIRRVAQALTAFRDTIVDARTRAEAESTATLKAQQQIAQEREENHRLKQARAADQQARKRRSAPQNPASPAKFPASWTPAPAAISLNG